METLRNRKHVLLFLGFSFGFLLLKLYNISPRVSDENFYFYAASLIAKGLMPYRDFFFQHLPSQIFLYALLIKIFGLRLYLLKFIHLVATLGSGFLLYQLLAERQRKDAALLALAFYLFSFVVLGTTDYALGVHEATFFLILSWYLFHHSTILGGLALFVGLTFRLYILPAALGFLALEFFKRNYRKVLQFSIFAILPFLILNLALFTLFGEEFLTPVWRYHFLKFSLSSTADEFPLFIRGDVILILFASVGAWLLFRNFLADFKKKRPARRRGMRLEQLGLSSAIALFLQFVFLKSLSQVFQFYFLTLIPFLSVLASLALSLFIPARSRRLALPLVVAISVVNGFFYQKDLAKLATLDNLERITADVRELAHEKDTIFGGYTITPLIALKAERKITENQIDTNSQRNLTGLLSADEATRLATKSAVFIQRAVIDYETGEIRRFDPFYVKRDIVVDTCKLFKDYKMEHGYRYNALLLWDCLGVSGFKH